MSPTEFEIKVIELVSDLLEISYSDAEAITMTKSAAMVYYYSRNEPAESVAKFIAL